MLFELNHANGCGALRHFNTRECEMHARRGSSNAEKVLPLFSPLQIGATATRITINQTDELNAVGFNQMRRIAVTQYLTTTGSWHVINRLLFIEFMCSQHSSGETPSIRKP